MSKTTKISVLAGVLMCLSLALSSCANHRLQDHADQKPVFDLVAYFDGHVKAHGQFQDRFGKIRRRFAVDIVGSWDGTALQLVEDFVYDDESTERRIWKIQRDGQGGWRGVADGVVGTASGKVVGNAMNWNYQFDLVTGKNKTMRVTFDDWLWLQSEDLLLNKAYVSRFGINVGEVTIFFDRQK